MSGTEHAYAFARGLASGFEALGVTRAHLSPGSRNTPLSLAFARQPGIETIIHLDERSSAFAALGSAKATGTPVVLLCTSGTAAAEYLPAVVEADLAGVPMIIITADRPPELIGVGAPQAIEQRDLYGSAVRVFHDSGVPDRDTVASLPGLVSRLWASCRGTDGGPVHLNVRFRDPLVSESPPDSPQPPPPAAVRQGRPQLDDSDIDELRGEIDGRPALLVVGAVSDPAFAGACGELADQWGIPVLADPQSGLRSTTSPMVIRAADALAAAGALDVRPPEVVIRIGSLPTSKPLWRWLERHRDVRQMFIEPAGWRDPLASSSVVWRSDPTATVEALAKLPVRQPAGFAGWWRAADDVTRQVLDEELTAAPFPTEPAIARIAVESTPAGGIVYVGSSMPIRDVDGFALHPAPGVSILANRGANGIDGLLSSALGAAHATGRPTTVLAGDLSALHDLTALLSARRLGVAFTVVIINNDGGGIFHFLPQAEVLDHAEFERLYGTPHGTDFVTAANGFGIEAHRIHDPAELARRVAAPAKAVRVLELATDRRTNVVLHRRIVARIAEVLATI